MTRNEVLKLACEEAGLDFSPDGARVVWAEPDGVLLEDFLVWENPALVAYVAELLLKQMRVRAVGNDSIAQFRYQPAMAGLVNGGIGFAARMGLADARTRILAALVALRKLTLEQAQEVN